MILVAGEALIDMLAQETDGHAVFRPVPGGSPYNVAMALGRLGVEVQFLCALSRDALGGALAERLERSGVDLALCPRTDALSTLGFVTLDPVTRKAIYAFYTHETAGCVLEPDQLPLAALSRIRCAHFGSFSLAVEPFGTALDALLEQLSESTVISLDPNIRSFLISDRRRYVDRLDRFFARAHLVKLSDDDLDWLGMGGNLEAAGRRLLDRGAGLVVVTRGQHGSFAMTQKGTAQARAQEVEVADTVGAGDTFQAAMLSWLARKNRLDPASIASLDVPLLREMLVFASRAAGVNCTRPGCDPPWQRELEWS